MPALALTVHLTFVFSLRTLHRIEIGRGVDEGAQLIHGVTGVNPVAHIAPMGDVLQLEQFGAERLDLVVVRFSTRPCRPRALGLNA